MIKLSPTGRTWLKGFHVVAMAVWVGSGISIMMLNLLASPTNGYTLQGVLLVLKLIDDVVLIPAAISALLTGLLLSWLTPWGFFKWRWVTVKWVLTIATMIFGTFWMGPWLNEMAAIATADPINALANSTLAQNRWLLLVSAGPMLITMITMIFISIIKPWKRQRLHRGQ